MKVEVRPGHHLKRQNELLNEVPTCRCQCPPRSRASHPSCASTQGDPASDDRNDLFARSDRVCDTFGPCARTSNPRALYKEALEAPRSTCWAAAVKNRKAYCSSASIPSPWNSILQMGRRLHMWQANITGVRKSRAGASSGD